MLIRATRFTVKYRRMKRFEVDTSTEFGGGAETRENMFLTSISTTKNSQQ